MKKGVAKKHILGDRIHGWHHRIYKVGRSPRSRSEKEILIDFGHPVAYDVVKLSLKGLPTADSKGKHIVWFNNFAVVDSHGRFVKKVKYTVFLPALRKGAKSITYEDGRLNDQKLPRWKGTHRPRSHMVQLDFTTGDPAVGCH